MNQAQKSLADKIGASVREILAASPAPKKRAQEIQAEIERERLGLAAELVLAQIPTQVKIAKLEVRSHAEILTLGPKDHNGDCCAGMKYRKLQPEWLRGIAELVYASCQAAGLAPEIHRIQNGEDWDLKIVIPVGSGDPNPARID